MPCCEISLSNMGIVSPQPHVLFIVLSTRVLLPVANSLAFRVGFLPNLILRRSYITCGAFSSHFLCDIQACAYLFDYSGLLSIKDKFSCF